MKKRMELGEKGYMPPWEQDVVEEEEKLTRARRQQVVANGLFLTSVAAAASITGLAKGVVSIPSLDGLAKHAFELSAHHPFISGGIAFAELIAVLVASSNKRAQKKKTLFAIERADTIGPF